MGRRSASSWIVRVVTHLLSTRQPEDRFRHSLPMKFSVLLACLAFSPLLLRADFSISKNAKPACVVVQQAGATEAERSAARELTNTLRLITGAEFEVSPIQPKPSQHAIVIGPGEIAKAS